MRLVRNVNLLIIVTHNYEELQKLWGDSYIDFCGLDSVE